MKRVRIMLMAICLIAVAGGVLAFKVMTPGGFCTTSATTHQAGGPKVCTNAQGAPLDCPNFTNTILTTTTATANVFCAANAPNDRCTLPSGSAVKCSYKVTSTTEQ